MRKRRFELTVDRPDWRDPAMPVLMNCTDSITGKPYIREFTSERAQYAFQMRMKIGTAPTFANDPTYNLRKGK